MRDPIAIVGMACQYPDAASPDELFDNVLAGRRSFRRIPDERLPLDQYGSNDPSDVDSTYVTQAAVIEGYHFDRLRFKIVGSTYRSADLTHWLALDVADRALCDAGFAEAEGLPRETTGVVLGNTLTGEFSRAQAMRLRWPYVRSLVSETLREVVPEAGRHAELLEQLEARYKQPFEPFGDESLAGGLANTIAGRVCNYFDLGGGGFTVDGACASSLLAVSNACAALAAGDLDVALAGGVDLSLDPFELVGFARAGALARDEMRVYDRRSQGFWPGEGCGILVLMREADACAQGRRIYARVCGWGIASDGAGGISRPEENGQLLALNRAYAKAGFGPETIAYFEGHGTGTEVGDETELGALTRLLAAHGGRAAQPARIGSIKANIGHTKAASGVAGLIKAALALQRQLLPPTPACERPHRLADPERGALLQVQSRVESWPADRALRTGVSSMGFGGINTHVVLDAVATRRKPALAQREHTLAHTSQDAELFLLGADDDAALQHQIEALLPLAPKLSRAELSDLAAAMARDVGRMAVRGAVIAASPDMLVARLTELLELVGSGGTGRPHLDVERGLFLHHGDDAARIGLLFPGQGAPIHADLGRLGQLFEVLRPGDPLASLYADAIARYAGPKDPGAGRPLPSDTAGAAARDIVDTAIAQPAIIAASVASTHVLAALGISGDLAVGHSVGEIAALEWAGALTGEQAVALAATRGAIISELGRPDGAMASLAVGPEQLDELTKDVDCCLAALNGPQRSVISGDRLAVERVVALAREKRIAAVPLSVSHAFHSPHVADCAPALKKALSSVAFKPTARRIVSTRTAAELTPGADLGPHLVAQLTDPVLFADAVRRASADVDLFIEVGPGRMLSGLVREFDDTPAVALDTGRAELRPLLAALGAAFALGAAVRPDRLFEHRFTKPFDPVRPLEFFANPCSAPVASTPRRDEPTPQCDELEGSDERSTLETLIALVAERCELPTSAICGDDRFLSDLHLTSIAVSELASAAARRIGRPPLVAPNEFADARVCELAEAIDSEERILSSHAVTGGIDTWVRPFRLVSVPRPCPRASVIGELREGGYSWRAFIPSGDSLGEQIAQKLRREAGCDGVLVHLPKNDMAESLPLLMSAARAAFEGTDARVFTLVHHGDAGVAIARTLHQEARSLATRVVEIPEDCEGAVDLVHAEVRAAAVYAEARYDTSGTRLERRLQPLEIADSDEVGALPLDDGDVLLVTGGGKGIAAECALALARETGCALGIVGRSTADADDELRTNLQRFAAAGLRVRYAAADVADARAVGRAVDEIESALGRVSGLLHGAGVNRPRSLSVIGKEEFDETLAPKLRGLENLLARLDTDRLRCLIGFGSILAELGLPGEAHYALANELLARQIEAFAARHPDTRCLCIEWSIWSGVGMGERLGRVEILAAQNISAITPEEGLRWLRRLLATPGLPPRIFLSGRFGSPPTLAVEEREVPMARFLERTREHTPGIELVADAELSFESDPYLADHVYAGEAILPGVMGLEAMAQCALALAPHTVASTGETGLPVLENVRFDQPVVMPRDGKRGLRVAGLSREDGRIQLALRSDGSDYQLNHMSADAFFVARDHRGNSTDRDGAQADPAASASGAATAPVLDPSRELYGDLFFHSGRFERVRCYRALGAFHCEAEIACTGETFFGPFEPQRMVLGDAGARDAAIHAIQACVPDRDLLPIGVDRITPCVLGDGDRVLLSARERSRGDGLYVWDLTLSDETGNVVECWEGLRLKEVAGGRRRERWPAALLAPHIEDIAARCLSLTGLRAALVPGDTHEASQRALAIAGGARGPIARRPDGKPLGDRGQHVSTSHGGGCTLAVAAPSPVACDMETVTTRSAATWRDLLGEDRYRAARILADDRSESFDTAATRLWGAIECLRKAELQHGTPVTLASGADDEIVLLGAGRAAIASLVAEIDGAPQPVVITLLRRGGDAGV